MVLGLVHVVVSGQWREGGAEDLTPSSATSIAASHLMGGTGGRERKARSRSKRRGPERCHMGCVRVTVPHNEWWMWFISSSRKH